MLAVGTAAVAKPLPQALQLWPSSCCRHYKCGNTPDVGIAAVAKSLL